MIILNKYNNMDYIIKNFKYRNAIFFEYKDSMCALYNYSSDTSNNKYKFYFSCDTMYYEMDTQYFNTIEEFFEKGTIEGELIKDIWCKVEITGTEGF